jgi:spore maturation protein CgeB
MRVVIFAHSVVSCWNHGNAHFLRGVARELIGLGHDVRVHEPADGWSLANLIADQGRSAVDAYARDFPELPARPYAADANIEELLDGADLILVHEWNDPALVARIGQARCGGVLLFHDTHHRAVSSPDAIRAFDLSRYDGVLAFGGALAEIYRRWGWGARAFVWHEAADTRLFRPPAEERTRSGLVWVGNWGDDERSAELHEFLLHPASAEVVPLDVYGVRYPPAALEALDRHGARYCGWLANARVPEVFARHVATMHVPRRFYTWALPGIPTIRVFEALACGIPLLCSPWDDDENLFRAGRDFLMASDGDAMRWHLRAVLRDPAMRAELAASGLETIRARHTCRHRAEELLAIAAALGTPPRAEAA